MKAIKVTLVLIGAALILRWMRADYPVEVIRGFPGVGGSQSSGMHLAGALAMLALTGWGLVRLMRQASGGSERDTGYTWEEEYVDDDETDEGD